MPFESLHSKLCGKNYGHFANTAQDKPELCTVVFQLNFRGRVLVIGFCIMNESIAGRFSYWGFIAQLEVGGERYGFLK